MAFSFDDLREKVTDLAQERCGEVKAAGGDREAEDQ